MKKTILSLISIFAINTVVMAQQNLNLVLNHKFNNEAFAYGSIYTDNQGRAMEITRMQYFMSSIELTHDGGLLTPLTDVYVLASGNISNYSLGAYDIENVETLNFDLGVDYDANHSGTSNYDASHPLGPKSPPMDWGWPSGYFFIVIDGKVDDNNDGTPNKWFQLHGLGDVLLQEVEVEANANVVDNDVFMEFDVNIDQWLNDFDLVTSGFEHSSNFPLPTVMQNTVNYPVFVANQSVGLDEANQINNISVDYTLAYAPTLYYQFADATNHELAIYDINGKLVLQEFNMGFEGNYFIKKELAPGMYVARFNSGKNTFNHKFIVQH